MNTPLDKASSRSVAIIRSRSINPGTYKVADILAKNGYNVQVILWNRDREKHKFIEKVNNYSVIYFNLRAPHDKVTVIPLLPLWWIYEFIFLFIKNSINVIHAYDFDTLWPAVLIKLLKKRVKLVYSIQDFYSENLPECFPSLIRNMINILEKLLIKYCDAVFLVNPAMYYHLRGSFIKRVKVIYNSPPDIKKTENLSVKMLRTNPPELIIFYAGQIHRSRGLIELLKALRSLNNVKLIVAGRGPDISIFLKIPEDLKNKINYIGVLPYNEVIRKTLEADVIVALYDPKIPNNRYASPNKLFEAMMCSKPIIINKETFAAKIVEKVKCGLTVPYGDINGIKGALIMLRDNPHLRMELGYNGRKAYEKIFCWELMKKKIIETYKELLEEKL